MTTKKIIIPYSPRLYQVDLEKLEDQYRFVVAVCHRRFGKTVKGAIRLIKSALNATNTGKEDYRGYYIAPTQKQAKRIVWHFFKRYLKNFGKMVTFNETELRIEFNIGRSPAHIYLVGSENIENLRGVYIDDCVLDEMASWSNAEYAFYEVLFPAMSDRNGRGFIIGTVKGLDMFYELSQMGQDKDLYPDWHTVIYTVLETGVFTEEQIALFKRMMKEDAFNREYMCDFFAEVPDRLMSPEEVMNAVNREPDMRRVKESPEIWGYDVGFTGDPSKLARRRGTYVHPLYTIKDKDSDYQAIWLKAKIKLYRPKIIYIDAGYGEGVISKLSNDNEVMTLTMIIPIWFNGTSPIASCYNMRAYMYFMVKKWLKIGSLPPGQKLVKQLSNQLLDQNDPQNRIKLLSKKEIKKVLRESPDESDAVALTFAGGNEEILELDDMVNNPEDRDIMVLKELLFREKREDKKWNNLDSLDTYDNNFSIEDLDK